MAGQGCQNPFLNWEGKIRPPFRYYRDVGRERGSGLPDDPRGQDARERFRAVYDEFVGPVHDFCRRRLGSSGGVAEDVTADIFTVVWRNIDKVPPPPERRTYVFGIAWRQVRRHRQKLWRRRGLQRRLEAEWTAGGAAGRAAPVHDARQELVYAAVQRLPAAERDALLLVLWDGFSHAEAGQVLGCTANAVALRLHKARARLRLDLETEATGRSEPPDLHLYQEGS